MDKFYLSLIILCILFIYIEVKNNKEHKRKNIKVLFLLENDGKSTRFICKAMLVLISIVSIFFIINSMISNNIASSNGLIRLLIPIFIIIAYIPFVRKTRITTLGIYKRMKFLNWEDIERIKYFDPTKKGIVSVNVIGKNIRIDLSFNDDSELERFKNTVSEYVKE